MTALNKAIKSILSLGIVVVLILGSHPLSATTTIDKVVAIVDDTAITMSEYRNYHKQQRFENTQLAPFKGEVNRRVLDRLIDEHIQERRAQLRGIQVSEQEVDQAVQFVAIQNNITPQALITQLERDGFTYEDFRESLSRQQLIQKLVDVVANSRVVVSDQEINNHIAAHEELQSNDTTFEVAQLFVATKNKTATEILREQENMSFILNSINKGMAFEAAVEDYADESAKQNAGYLGWRSASQLPDLFLSALRSMNVTKNNISGILRSENGFHILKLLDVKDDSKKIQQQLVQHILIQPDVINNVEESKNLAQEISEKIKQGESFDKLARLYSADLRSKESGGSLGWINPGSTLPKFEKAVNALPLNTVSDPVRTNFGFHIIRVLDRREVNMSEEIAINQAREIIFRRKSDDLYQRWFRTARKQSFVEYIEE